MLCLCARHERRRVSSQVSFNVAANVSVTLYWAPLSEEKTFPYWLCSSQGLTFTEGLRLTGGKRVDGHRRSLFTNDFRGMRHNPTLALVVNRAIRVLLNLLQG